MNEYPLLSIGIPVYNSEHCVGKAIDSIRGQSYRNVEIIISDNCSTDRTREICRKYAEKDGRIRYHRSDVNIGKEPNFLRVLELAKGEYFAWTCADDIRPAGSLEGLMGAILKSRATVMAHGPVIAEAITSTAILPNRMSLTARGPSERVGEYVKGVEHNAIQYAVFQTNSLKRAYLTTDFITNHYGHDYHLCLQMCLLGPIEYSSTPMIIYKEGGVQPTFDPMGLGTQITIGSLLGGGRAITKAWTTLLYGSYYLLRPTEVGLAMRLKSVFAFIGAFTRRYGRRLLRDGLLIVTQPLTWLVSRAWPLARRSSFLFSLGQKIKAKSLPL
jgi:glycosyltransferase involved in cell wall biosynthesis